MQRDFYVDISNPDINSFYEKYGIWMFDEINK